MNIRKESEAKLNFYLDTNILLDILRKRGEEAIKLFDLIKANKQTCSTSQFALMELIEQEKTRSFARKLLLENKKDIHEIVRIYRQCDLNIEELSTVKTNIFNRSDLFDYIDLFDLTDDGWYYATELALTTNLSAPDCIHLAIASITYANFLVTTDSHLIKSAEALEISCKTPDSAIRLFD